jgi:hypothetical protein
VSRETENAAHFVFNGQNAQLAPGSETLTSATVCPCEQLSVILFAAIVTTLFSLGGAGVQADQGCLVSFGPQRSEVVPRSRTYAQS